MQVITNFEGGSAPIKAWVGTKQIEVDRGGWNADVPDIEDSAMQQLRNLASMPFIARNGIAVMPDVHAGIGATVGSVIATRKAIIPAAVGVDIGCGMNAVRTSLRAEDLPESLAKLRSAIEAVVPVGQGQHNDDATRLEKGLWTDFLPIATQLNLNVSVLSRVQRQVGTLGGGNHFIEVCLDEAGFVWVMLHSGSRGIGNIIGRTYINIAKERMARFYIDLPDADLAYLPEGDPDFTHYVTAVNWAQDYARWNRQSMMHKATEALQFAVKKKLEFLGEAVNCHHNYISRENHFNENLWVTRKGAISAREGQLGIIPGSMGQRSYIVRGKGLAESYCSCSHGAGRVMSRTQARKAFTLDDLAAQTAGVECRKDAGVLDEIPGAYKDIDTVMNNQADLVSIEHTLKQILCIKG